MTIMDNPTDNSMETSVDANKSDGEILQQDPETKQMVVDEEIASCSRNIEECQNGDGDGNLFEKLKNIIGTHVCFPERQQQTTHFSDIPFELVVKILTYNTHNVYNVNHLKMLDQFAAVCRGWYLCARDPVLYRQACLKLWSENIMQLEEYGGSWRRMLIERSPIFTFGCYIASIQNTSTERCYYYIKFYSDGRFAFLKTWSNPEIMTKTFQWNHNMHPDHPWGRYISYGDCVRLQFAEKPTGSENNLYDKALNHINFMVFKIVDFETKRNWQLYCKKLEVIFNNGVPANIFTQRGPRHIYYV